ncbi:MAG TPA: hypothetical protein VKV40_19315 [Ktedonobacteraceae bacterium]|nr:hypothetical protein [Ktedonobacteraceae bacterium]
MTCTGPILGNPCLNVWNYWDANAYVRIAFQGYKNLPDTAFFPLWPSVMHLGGWLLGPDYQSSYYVAGLLISNICFFFTLVLLYLLLAEDFEPSLASRALFYLSFYPYALFFFLGYSESLFVLLCVAVFFFLRRRKMLDWWVAGGLGFLATLTRSTGVMLCIPFFVVYLKHFWLSGEREQSRLLQKLVALLPLVLIPAAILAYLAYLGHVTGNPFIFQWEEAHYWHRQFSPLWSTFAVPIQRILVYPFFSLTVVQNLVDLAFILLPVIALIVGWKLLPLHYSLFALGIMLFSLSFTLSPQHSLNTLASEPRYMMSAFPVFIIFAIWGKRQRFNQFYLAIAIAMLAVNSLLFVTHYWVA